VFGTYSRELGRKLLQHIDVNEVVLVLLDPIDNEVARVDLIPSVLLHHLSDRG
jgi:hypothetical protein